MRIEHLLLIPDKENIEASLKLAETYGCGFEYNDFFRPDNLDRKEWVQDRISFYQGLKNKPAYCTLHGAFLDVTVFSEDAKIRQASDERVEQSLKIASEIGAIGVIFHTNYIPNFLEESYRNAWVEKNAQYWAEKASAYPHLNIYMENMFDTDFRLLAELGEKMQSIPNFGICFDYAHAHAFGNVQQIEEWVKALAPFVRHIHINDNDFLSDSHLALGDGKIKWDEFKKYYEKYFSEASVLIEVTRKEKIKKSLDYLKRL